MLGGAGKQAEAKPLGSFTVTKSSRPFELTFTPLNVWSYNENENGSEMNVSPSSVWLPVSVSPGTIVSLPVVNVYWQTLGGVAVGVGVGVGVPGVGDGVGVGPKARLNAPILSRHPMELVVGTYSLMYQKVVSSVGSISSAV